MDDKVKLVIQIKNSKPIELLEFSDSMIAAANEFEDFLILNNEEAADAKLYIKEIRQGSIITELVALAPYVLPIIEHSETVITYAEHLKKIFEIFLNDEKTAIQKIEKKTLNQTNQILNPVANDSASQINIGILNVNAEKVDNIISLDSRDSNAIQNSIRKELDRRKEPENGLISDVVLFWSQTTDLDKKSGTRGKIESLYDGDVRVKLTDELKKIMVTEQKYPYKVSFLVNVDVQTRDGRPILYIVKELHEVLED